MYLEEIKLQSLSYDRLTAYGGPQPHACRKSIDFLAAFPPAFVIFFPTSHFPPSTMTSIAEGLFKSLPKPKYTGEDEELPQHAQPRGPRVVGPDQIDESQIVLRVGPSITSS